MGKNHDEYEIVATSSEDLVIQLHNYLQKGFDSILQYLNFTFLSHFLFWFVEQLQGRNSDKTRE